MGAKQTHLDRGEDEYLFSVPDVNFGLAIHDGHAPGLPLIYCNSRFTKVTGHAVGAEGDRLYGLGFLRGFHTDASAMDNATSGIENCASLQQAVACYTKEGRPFVNLVTVAPATAKQGRSRGRFVLVLHRDVTTLEGAPLDLLPGAGGMGRPAGLSESPAPSPRAKAEAGSAHTPASYYRAVCREARHAAQVVQSALGRVGAGVLVVSAREEGYPVSLVTDGYLNTMNLDSSEVVGRGIFDRLYAVRKAREVAQALVARRAFSTKALLLDKAQAFQRAAISFRPLCLGGEGGEGSATTHFVVEVKWVGGFGSRPWLPMGDTIRTLEGREREVWEEAWGGGPMGAPAPSGTAPGPVIRRLPKNFRRPELWDGSDPGGSFRSTSSNDSWPSDDEWGAPSTGAGGRGRVGAGADVGAGAATPRGGDLPIAFAPGPGSLRGASELPAQPQWAVSRRQSGAWSSESLWSPASSWGVPGASDGASPPTPQSVLPPSRAGGDGGDARKGLWGRGQVEDLVEEWDCDIDAGGAPALVGSCGAGGVPLLSAPSRGSRKGGGLCLAPIGDLPGALLPASSLAREASPSPGPKPSPSPPPGGGGARGGAGGTRGGAPPAACAPARAMPALTLASPVSTPSSSVRDPSCQSDVDPHDVMDHPHDVINREEPAPSSSHTPRRVFGSKAPCPVPPPAPRSSCARPRRAARAGLTEARPTPPGSYEEVLSPGPGLRAPGGGACAEGRMPLHTHRVEAM